MKYCLTCMIYRPRRTIHCSYCNTCIEQLDHHCPFIAKCVGRRNYGYFYLFINTLMMNSLFIVVITICDLVRRLNQQQTQNSLTDSQTWLATMCIIPLSFPIILLAGVTMLGTSALSLFHFKLNLYNETTFETAKNTFNGYWWQPF